MMPVFEERGENSDCLGEEEGQPAEEARNEKNVHQNHLLVKA